MEVTIIRLITGYPLMAAYFLRAFDFTLDFISEHNDRFFFHLDTWIQMFYVIRTVILL